VNDDLTPIERAIVAALVRAIVATMRQEQQQDRVEAPESETETEKQSPVAPMRPGSAA
jgi:hypothetical protein